MSTPLYKKLGIKNNSSILILNQPKAYPEFFSDFPSGVTINENCDDETVEFIHIFVRTFKELEDYFKKGKSRLAKNGSLWVSWPKKSSKIDTELDKFKIMKHGLENGLVDVKIASIDENWSGLKFVYRLKDR